MAIRGSVGYWINKGGGSGEHNVLAYGAIGDGTTDDATAIQSAIDAAGVDNGTVFFPPGTYRIATRLYPASGITIASSGGATIISDASCIYTMQLTSVSDVKIRDIAIDHLNTSATNMALKIDTLSKNILIDNVTIDSKATCISIRDGINCVVRNCKLSAPDAVVETRVGQYTGAISSGSNELTLTTWPAADHSQFAAGQYILVEGAGSGGSSLITTISSVGNSTNKKLWLADNASTTVSSAHVRLMQDADTDTAFPCHVFDSNVIIQEDNTRPGLEIWTGGTRVVNNKVVSPGIAGGAGGITVGIVYGQTVANNYVFGFAYGIEIGRCSTPGDYTLAVNNIGAVTVANNVVESCGIGISVTSDGMQRAVKLIGNHIIHTREGSFTYYYPIRMNTDYCECEGNSITYRTKPMADYTSSSSRSSDPAVVISASGSRKFVFGSGTIIGFDKAFQLSGQYLDLVTVRDTTIENCNRLLSAQANVSGDGVAYPRKVVFDNCFFINVMSCVFNNSVYFRNCHFKRNSDANGYNKNIGLARDTYNTYSEIDNCVFDGVLGNLIDSSSNRPETVSGYANADATYYRGSNGDYVYLGSTYTTHLKIKNLFTSLGISPPNTEYLVYSGGQKFRKTQQYWVVYSTISSDPSSGTFEVGDRIENTSPSAGGNVGKICVTAGTQGTLSGVTGSITSGSTTLTVNTATGLEVGMYITIAGVSGIKKITAISGTTVTIDTAADATVSGAAVSYSNATFKTYAAIAS